MTSTAIVPNSGTTFYAQLAGVLRGRILRGEWSEGDPLPTLPELCEQYGVARITARQAIQLLTTEGLVSSRRGRRTLVSGTPLSSRPLFQGLADPLEQVPDYSVRILKKDATARLPAVFSGRGKLDRGYVLIRKVDSEAGVPYSVSTIYVAKGVYRRLPRDAELTAKLSRLVRSALPGPFLSAQETISVAAADLEDAEALGCPLSSPVARVERVFLSGDEVIVYAGWSVYRGDRFVLRRDLADLGAERNAPNKGRAKAQGVSKT